MLLGFKTELKLNNQQRTQLAKHCGVSRHAWNWGLELTRQILDHNKANPQDKIKFPTAVDLHKWLVALVKPEWLHRKIANIRKDTLHKLTSYLAKNHSKIGIEDLNVSGMLANHKLAKAIADMGFHEFRRQLSYKCELYGSELVVVDRWFASSKTCSNCGTKKETLSLSQRVFHCDRCGLEIDRDLNASINLEKAVS